MHKALFRHRPEGINDLGGITVGAVQQGENGKFKPKEEEKGGKPRALNRLYGTSMPWLEQPAKDLNFFP